MLKGSIPALITPFDKNQNVDEEKLDFFIDWHIKNGTDAILVCGTTGESATLTHTEHRQVISRAIKHTNGKIPIIAGCGSNSTQEALGLVEFAQEEGADYALVITPYYNRPTQEGLYQHYKAIDERTKIPVLIYNVPSRTGTNILPETVARIYRDCKNVAGIKEASGNISQIEKLMTLVDNDFLLLSGDDALTLPIMAVGGVGVISVVANIMPQETHQLTEAFFSGDIKKAKEIQLYLYELIKMMFIETNPIPVKTALSLMGMLDLSLRLPLCPMNEENYNKLKAVLTKYKLIS